MSVHLEDASGFGGDAERVLTPASPEEVCAILREASASATPVTVCGAHTGVTGGGVPLGGWAISLEKFTKLEVGQGTAVAGAGVPLQALQDAAARTRQFYPPDPTEWTAALGGSIATNGSGSRSFYYGATRRWVRALEVCFMDGSRRRFQRGEKVDFPYTPLPAKRVTKHAAGYWLREDLDWVDLLVGSEGTLGVILEAEVGLLPQPEGLLTGIVFFPSEKLSLRAAAAWRTVPQLRMLEFIDGPSLETVHGKIPETPLAGAALLVEQLLDGLAGDPVDEWMERLEATGALAEESWFGDTAADRERFRRWRHTLAEATNERIRATGLQKLSTDFAVPFDRLPEMMAFYRERLNAELPGKNVIYGHIGDGHPHLNVLPETEEDLTRMRGLILEFARKAVELGGTVSAEHGLGKRKTHLLAIEYGPEEIEAMCAVKRRLDPQWLLGQGTLFANEHV